MEKYLDSKTDIIGGIISEATREAEAIIKEADTSGQERKRAGASQAKRIIKEAEDRVSAQIEGLERESTTRVAAARRRIGLEMRRKIYESITEGVSNRLVEDIGTDSYRRTLTSWIVEAALGLRANVAMVNASVTEREILPDLLAAAESEISRLGGNPTILMISDDPPLSSQGIVLTSGDGKTAFSNQARARLVRYESEIRRMVHNRLFRDTE